MKLVVEKREVNVGIFSEILANGRHSSPIGQKTAEFHRLFALAKGKIAEELWSLRHLRRSNRN